MTARADKKTKVRQLVSEIAADEMVLTWKKDRRIQGPGSG